MNIFIQASQTHVFEVSSDTLVEDIKNFVADVEDVDDQDFCLYAKGRVLDQESLKDLEHGSKVEVCLRLLGGKVHGSLARAGKVKGQTPKVEKQEKKRKKCGRARRRILYQKRFVNVVNTPGKRRGPNSNVQG